MPESPLPALSYGIARECSNEQKELRVHKIAGMLNFSCERILHLFAFLRFAFLSKNAFFLCPALCLQ